MVDHFYRRVGDLWNGIPLYGTIFLWLLVGCGDLHDYEQDQIGMDEFKAPENRGFKEKVKGLHIKETDTILKPLDQTVVTAVMLILIALLGWMAYTSHQNGMGIAALTAQFESIRQERDLSMVYIERRLESLESSVQKLTDEKTERDRK